MWTDVKGKSMCTLLLHKVVRITIERQDYIWMAGKDYIWMVGFHLTTVYESIVRKHRKQG